MRNINFFTYDYPFEGNDHRFIEDELSMISNLFDRVNVIPIRRRKNLKKNFIKKKNIYYDFSLSKNIFKLKNIINIFSRVIFCKYFWKEIFNLTLNNIFLKTKMIIFERILAENTRIWITRNDNLNLQNDIFYSYWSNFTLISFYFLKKEKKINFCFARTLGSDLNGFIPFDNFLAYKSIKFRKLDLLLILNFGQFNNLVKENLIDKEKIIKCYQGIKYFKQKIRINLSKKIHLISCGRLNYVKNSENIIKFIKIFKKIFQNYEIKYTCIGDGPEIQKIQKLAKIELKEVDYEIIKNVKSLPDFLNENEVDYFINLSHSEGMSFAIMEAMSFGIPIICSNIPGNTEIINKLNGYIIKSNADIEFQNVINQIKVDFENHSKIDELKLSVIKTVKNKINREDALLHMKKIIKKKFIL